MINMRSFFFIALLFASAAAVVASSNGQGVSNWLGDYSRVVGVIKPSLSPYKRYAFITKGNQVWRFFQREIQGNEILSEPTIPDGITDYSDIRLTQRENSTTPWGTKWNYDFYMQGEKQGSKFLSLKFTPTTALNISSSNGRIIHNEDGSIFFCIVTYIKGDAYGLQGIYANDIFYSIGDYGSQAFKFEFSNISGGSCYLDSIDLHRSDEGSTWFGQGAGCKFMFVLNGRANRAVVNHGKAEDDLMIQAAKETQHLKEME